MFSLEEELHSIFPPNVSVFPILPFKDLFIMNKGEDRKDTDRSQFELLAIVNFFVSGISNKQQRKIKIAEVNQNHDMIFRVL